ncbi:MAG TPA: hypothetical protein VK973_18165 [Arenicellales bacterium]|nr:hypothetical protein [Arenicellales bacterium]
MTVSNQHEFARQVREQCINTAVQAYENASISGLCGEGAFEAAISAIRMMDIEALVEQLAREADETADD